MYAQNSIFLLSFLKNEKIISAFFDIDYHCRYRLCRYLRLRYLRRKINNLKLVNNLQDKNISLCYLMMPTREFKMTQ